MKANPTEAKDVALYFLEESTVQEPTPYIIGKTIKQVKDLMEKGYTKQDIMDVIDYLVAHGKKMYSFGYILTMMEVTMKAIQVKREAILQKVLLDEIARTNMNEVKVDAESAERNRSKADRFGIKSREREKYHFDMFEEHGQDS